MVGLLEEKRRLIVSVSCVVFFCFLLCSVYKFQLHCVCFRKICCSNVWLGTAVCHVLSVGQHAILAVCARSSIFAISHIGKILRIDYRWCFQPIRTKMMESSTFKRYRDWLKMPGLFPNHR